MWLISWLSTPSSSSRFIVASSPVVAVIAALSGLMPVANAFGDGSSITNTCGLGMPSPIASASTMLCSCAYFCGSAGFAPDAESTRLAPDVRVKAIPARASRAAIPIPTDTSPDVTPPDDPADDDPAETIQPRIAPMPTHTTKNSATYSTARRLLLAICWYIGVTSPFVGGQLEGTGFGAASRTSTCTRCTELWPSPDGSRTPRPAGTGRLR